ncbi:MAG: sigma-70 family RNA polymerase sigma factor [Saprospiraceae bacterium]|nr:sigma-70 family RNA polymerase sigma factor [Saprospiraceae bacterium]
MQTKATEQPQDLDFERRMALLRQGNAPAWATLVGRFRQVTLPWLNKRLGALPAYSMLGRQEFALEIFSESLLKFYELFEKGHFEKEQDLQSLLFKITELKMKEAFARLKKESLIYRPADTESMDALARRPDDWNTDDDLARERALTVQKHLQSLEEPDRNLLLQVYGGEKMSRIARVQGISEESLRKRKQRALDRLKKRIENALMIIWILWSL